MPYYRMRKPIAAVKVAEENGRPVIADKNLPTWMYTALVDERIVAMENPPAYGVRTAESRDYDRVYAYPGDYIGYDDDAQLSVWKPEHFEAVFDLVRDDR